jgi:hypothetical protein
VDKEFNADITAGSPDYWYPDRWLCFLLLGRPAPVEKRCLVVTESKTQDSARVLEELRSISSKSTRRSLAEETNKRQKVYHNNSNSSIDKNSEVIDLSISPPLNSCSTLTTSTNSSRQIEVSVRRNNDSVSDDDKLLIKCQALLDILYKQAIQDENDIELQTQIKELERKKIKILRLQFEQLEKKLGYDEL